jgi:hypothetical protein
MNDVIGDNILDWVTPGWERGRVSVLRPPSTSAGVHASVKELTAQDPDV